MLVCARVEREELYLMLVGRSDVVRVLRRCEPGRRVLVVVDDTLCMLLKRLSRDVRLWCCACCSQSFFGMTYRESMEMFYSGFSLL